ncbi:hypothetical protein [Pontimicrobium sp. MEBiC06410]|jgi:hypothetical protein
MEYLTFKKEVKWAVANDNKYDLLGLFVTDAKFEINKIIDDLQSIIKGEKVFDDIQDPEMSWSFGNASGYFEVEGETAYFEPYEDVTDSPRVVMPLKELIGLLKEWKSFLDKN